MLQNKKRESPNLEADRYQSLITSHPLFGLLQYFLLKCERCTLDLNSNQAKVDEKEILGLLSSINASEKNGQRNFKWKTGNGQLDELMLAAIQVLRIQLMELEKVDELCKDFCSRYSACLKGKMIQEMLMGWSDIGDDDSCSPPNSALSEDSNEEFLNEGPATVVATMQTPTGQLSIPLLVPFLVPQSRKNSLPASSTSTPASSSKRKLSLNDDTVEGNVDDASSNILIQSLTAAKRPTFEAIKSAQPRDQDLEQDYNDGKRHSNDGLSSLSNAGKGKRGSLPKRSVDILRTWLFQNMRHPYPSEDEKKDLCSKSGLNLLQVNNWFINARRRILQPLLDGTAANLLASVSSDQTSEEKQSSSERKKRTSQKIKSPLDANVAEKLEGNGKDLEPSKKQKSSENDSKEN